jgi:hypothetical protein
MKVYIDGKEVEVINDIRVVPDENFVVGQDNKENDIYANLNLILNHEGIMLDMRMGENAEPVNSAWQSYVDLIELCY